MPASQFERSCHVHNAPHSNLRGRCDHFENDEETTFTRCDFPKMATGLKTNNWEDQNSLILGDIQKAHTCAHTHIHIII